MRISIPFCLSVLLTACGSDDAPLPDPVDSGSDTATPSTTTTTATTTGGTTPFVIEDGQVVSLWEDRAGLPPANEILGFFATTHDGLPAPALCAMRGMLCTAELPTASGDWIEWVDTSYDPNAVGVTWVGNNIDVGGSEIPFSVDAETGFGGYRSPIASPTGMMDVTIGGEWEIYTATEALPAAGPIELIDPQPADFVDLEDIEALAISWQAAPGNQVYIEVDREGAHRTWLTEDDGSIAIPIADLGDVGPGDLADVHVYRRIVTPELDANGNDLTLEAWSIASFRAGITGDRSCKAILDASPASTSGVYLIQPNPIEPAQSVYCDMDTDGGGWTLVASTLDAPPNDSAMGYVTDLTTLLPAATHDGVWTGMRGVISGNSDLRFACKTAALQPDMEVDLSFYDTHWYREITTGTDAQSCFNEGDGSGADPAPERRNNLTGAVLPAGDAWNFGYLEGEDACASDDDFTIDFDDRGMDGDQSDGTDWGEDDGTLKCGVDGLNGGVWFLFTREP